MRFWAFVLILLVGGSAEAQKKTNQAEIIHQNVHIYQKRSQSSPVISRVRKGQIFDVSQKPTQGFYRIRIKPGLLGYVSESDVRPPGKKRSFQHTLFTGFQYALIQFQENTMGGERRESLGFFGAKLSGPDLVVEGAMPTEVNFMFHAGAPSYYEKLTGLGADGWIFLGNFLWQSYFPQGPNALTFVGFGPELRYSKFRASLLDPSTGKPRHYLMDDMTVGAVFNAGVSLRVDKIALRGDFQYHWEEQKYWGSSLAIQFGF